MRAFVLGFLVAGCGWPLDQIQFPPIISDGGTSAPRDMARPAIDWVRVPGGPFLYGCTVAPYPDQVAGEWTETAPTADFMRTHVTVGQYRACFDAGVCSAPILATGPPASLVCNWTRTGTEAHPINCVSWSQAVAFCGWIGGRLATSIEWEHAARPDGRTYPWGEDDPACNTASARAWCGQGADVGTDAAGSQPTGRSRDGLDDMAGNVWEWLGDDYNGGKEIRGGRWNRDAGDLRSCIRFSAIDPEAGVGVRCVR